VSAEGSHLLFYFLSAELCRLGCHCPRAEPNWPQPLDSNHHFKVIVVVVTFVGKWVAASVIHLIHKKAAGALCAQLSVGLSNDSVRLLI